MHSTINFFFTGKKKVKNNQPYRNHLNDESSEHTTKADLRTKAIAPYIVTIGKCRNASKEIEIQPQYILRNPLCYTDQILVPIGHERSSTNLPCLYEPICEIR